MFDAEPLNESPPSEEAPPPDRTLQSFSKLRAYIRNGKAPWRWVDHWKREDLCDSARITPADVGVRSGKPFPLRSHRFVSSRAYHRHLRKRFSSDALDASVDDLRLNAPQDSASGVLSLAQLLLVSLVIICIFAALWKAPLLTIIILNAGVTAYFISSMIFRAFLLAKGAPALSPPPPISSGALPVITILLPLYRDAKALPALNQAMRAIEYPAEKLDIKILLEEDDAETRREAEQFSADGFYDIIIVPTGGPKTKPKACNFGMHFARGDLIVIYDAEDQPEPDQLLKAAAAFAAGDDKLACVQARLNYYNRDDNWLTRQFTLEYSLWFDWLLPALQRLGAPIPLGGTSNFLRSDVLMEAGGWDPFNVTEDADLGLRLSKLGYQVEILDSTTFEEANCQVGNWIRQRSRWMKGYLQTWLVHMRQPWRIVSTTGWFGLLSVQLFIAGNVLSALINPILWAVFITWLFTGTDVISAAFPGPLLWLNIFALTIGNFFFVMLTVIAPLKRGWGGLSIAGLTAPAYWTLTSVAAYKALWQIMTRPYYWEKTDHVISKAALKKREDALEASSAK
ncbi:MAG: glycosyltransferase family 2 protein [Pseudomonadota bacterium]